MTRRRYSTGNQPLDDAVAALIREAGGGPNSELIEQIVVSGLLMANSSRLDVKIVNAALKEMRYAFKVFSRYTDRQKVSVFGSARTKPGDLDYEQAREFGRIMASDSWMVVTGAGPGTMEGANAGAGAAASFGVNIRLPFEAEPNPVIEGDPKLINFKYFFTRKLVFIKEAAAFVLLPGGFGTMDEAFELLTLIQTGKSAICPVVLLDAPGGDYWTRWLDFVQSTLIDTGYVSPADLFLIYRTDSAADAAAHVKTFYANFVSMRLVGGKLALTLKQLPTDLEELFEEFSDIVRGPIRAGSSGDENRLIVDFDRTHYGRLRQMIDRLNSLAD